MSDPPRTRQSPFILAAFRPWGGSQGDATRGVGTYSTPPAGVTGHDRILPAQRSEGGAGRAGVPWIRRNPTAHRRILDGGFA